MADEVKLEPCPFCGGEAELDTSQAYRALSGGSLGSRAVVYCTRCGADMGFCYEDARGTPREDIVNQVVDDWNRRSPSPAPDMREAGEALKAARTQIMFWKATADKVPGHASSMPFIEPSAAAIDTIDAALRSLTGAKP